METNERENERMDERTQEGMEQDAKEDTGEGTEEGTEEWTQTRRGLRKIMEAPDLILEGTFLFLNSLRNVSGLCQVV